jgi:NAD(P)-dependent dehydrogenase (short-subunit alcohol dehydrogenase family)
VRAVPLVADSADEDALRAALDAATRELGPPDVVVYNAAVIRADAPGELSVRAHQDAWAVNVLGAVTAAAHVTVTGPVAAGTDWDPDDIAEHYWRLHVEPRDGWRREAVHRPTRRRPT